MVNEHLDVESHRLRRLLFVSDGNTTEIEGKESDRHGGTGGGGADWETYETRGKQEKGGEGGRSERPVNDGENKGKC